MSFGPLDMLNTLKTEWLAANKTPHADPDVAREDEQAMQLIKDVVFPNRHEFHDHFVWANDKVNADYLGLFVRHEQLVYDSVAMLFYASKTDALQHTAQDVGRELHEKGGIKLMQTVYYGYSWLVRKFLHDRNKAGWIAQVLYSDIDRNWNHVGNWRM